MRDENINGYLSIDPNRLSGMLDGGQHSDNTDDRHRYNNQRALFRKNNINPREYLMQKIIILGYKNRPKPMGSRTANN